MLIIVFGSSSVCQVVLSGFPQVSASPKGGYISIPLGYAAGISLGVWVASGSGGHINPAITLALACLRRFPWKKVPLYILSQVLGGMVGTLISYGNYMHAIKMVDPDKTRLSASFFALYAQDYLPTVACFFSEFLGAALLLMVLLAILDKRSGPPPPGLVPLVLFIFVLGLGICLGMNTSFGVNPARDFGPRIALSILGYSPSVIWNYRSQFWLWTGIIAPIFGAISGGAIYDAFLYTGEDSIFSGMYFTSGSIA
jgi:aquaglyceroporin related protein